MAHPDVGFFYPDDRVVVVRDCSVSFPIQLYLPGESSLPCVRHEHNDHQPHGDTHTFITHPLSTQVAGGTAITLPQFEPKSFLAALEQWKPTVLQLPPPLISFLADHPSVIFVINADQYNAHLLRCRPSPCDFYHRQVI